MGELQPDYLRAYQAAKALGIQNREFLARAELAGTHLKNFASLVSPALFELVKKGMSEPLSEARIQELRPLQGGNRYTCGHGGWR